MTDRTAATSLRDSALAWASEGFSIFPCKGKVPLTRNGHKDATADADQIRAWWRRYPDANVAVVPGLNGYVVADVDPRNGGDEALAALRNGSGTLPDTLVIATGQYPQGRGQHIWFRAEEARTASKADLGNGIELKASGGYVLVNPSRHASGVEYEVVSGSIAEICEAPSWARDPLVNHPRSSDAEVDPSALTHLPIGRRTLDAIENGLPEPAAGEYQRDVAVGIARNLREDGVGEDLALVLMRKVMLHEDASLNPDDPWTDEDVEDVVRSVYAAPAPDQAKHRRKHKKLNLKRASEIQMRRPEFLAGPNLGKRIPVGEMTTLGGEQGLGKSQYTYSVAASESRAGNTVLLFSLEETAETTVKPRLWAAGADLERCIIVELPGGFTIPEHIPLLRDALRELRDSGERVTLALFDPILGFIDEKYNTHGDQSSRRALDPLVEVLKDFQVAGVCVLHLNKDETKKSVLNRMGGSVVFTALPRSVLFFSRDPHNASKTDICLVSHPKHNLSPEEATQKWIISLKPWPKSPGEPTNRLSGGDEYIPYLEYAEDVPLSAQAVFAALVSEDSKSKVDEARQFYRVMLQDGEMHLLSDVNEQGRHLGNSDYALREARKDPEFEVKQIEGAPHEWGIRSKKEKK